MGLALVALVEHIDVTTMCCHLYVPPVKQQTSDTPARPILATKEGPCFPMHSVADVGAMWPVE
jgi:hypothetical protein